MNTTQKKDIAEFVQTFALSAEVSNASFLITGVTGHVGSSLVHCLLALSKEIRIIAPVRNMQKALNMYSEDELIYMRLIECDLATFDYEQAGKTDYIIHCASPTNNQLFVSQPVETFDAIYEPSRRLLTYAHRHQVKGFVFISSLEVYGVINDDSHPLSENELGYVDIQSARSSYPMAKRAVETLCSLYAAQYGVPAKVARLPQTIGAGVSRDDNRILAQFCRLAAEGGDIIMHTTGESARTYSYVTDAVSAILYILLRGQNGETYNVADEQNYISARGTAEMLRNEFNNKIEVRVELSPDMPYPPTTKVWMSSRKINALGWYARYDLHEIFSRLIDYYRETR